MNLRRQLLAVIFICWTPLVLAAEQLEIFTTDGCSSFPDGTPKQQSIWLECCIRHDLAYWKGGSYDERLRADQALERCVAGVGEPEIAGLMLAGVRVGGSPYYPTPYRWGYGWPFMRGYKPLNAEEQKQVRQKLDLLVNMLVGIAGDATPQDLDRPGQ